MLSFTSQAAPVAQGLVLFSGEAVTHRMLPKPTTPHAGPGHPGKDMVPTSDPELGPGCPQQPRVVLTAYSRIAFPGQGIALQAWAHSDVGEGVSAAAALDGDACGLGPDRRGCNDDARDLHQVGHHVRLQEPGGSSGKRAPGDTLRHLSILSLSILSLFIPPGSPNCSCLSPGVTLRTRASCLFLTLRIWTSTRHADPTHL